MSNTFQVQVGRAVKYRTASGRIRHAIVTSVTNQSTVDLRVGNGSTKLSVAAVAKVTKRVGTGAGWHQGQ